MKNSRKLIVMAVALVLTLAMATTTAFAWFAMNTQVTASGMEIKAQTDQIFLQIVNADGTFNSEDTQVSANAVNATKTVRAVTVVKALNTPATTAPVVFDGEIATGATSDHIWVANYSNNPGVSTAVGAYTDVTTAATATDATNDYTLINTFKLRLNPDAGVDTAEAALNVASVTVSAAEGVDDDMMDAVCVLVVCGEYTQLWKQNPAGTFVASGDTTLSNGAFTNPAEGYTVVTVYVFFDGDNAAVTTNNVTTNGYSVELLFTVAA